MRLTLTLLAALTTVACHGDKDGGGFGYGSDGDTGASGAYAGGVNVPGSGTADDPWEWDGSSTLSCSGTEWSEHTDDHFDDWAYAEESTPGIECACEFTVEDETLYLIDEFLVYAANDGGTPWDIRVEDNTSCEGPGETFYGYQTDTSYFRLHGSGNYVADDGSYWVAVFENVTPGYPGRVDGTYRVYLTRETQDGDHPNCADYSFPVYFAIDGEEAPEDAVCGERYNESADSGGWSGGLGEILAALPLNHTLRQMLGGDERVVRFSIHKYSNQLRVHLLGYDPILVDMIPGDVGWAVDVSTEEFTATGSVRVQPNGSLRLFLYEGQVRLGEGWISIPTASVSLASSGDDVCLQ